MGVVGSDADGFVREEAVVEVGAFNNAVSEEVVGAPDEDPVVFPRDRLWEDETCDNLGRWHERKGKSQGQACAKVEGKRGRCCWRWHTRDVYPDQSGTDYL